MSFSWVYPPAGIQEVAGPVDDNAQAVLSRPTRYQDEITRGLREGVTAWNKFAYRPDLDIADGEALIIADSSTNTSAVMTTAQTFDITFNDTTDGTGTTGALELTFSYIDANGEDATGTHNLGATSPETTSFTGLGINRIAVSSSGSNNSNNNDISIEASTDNTIQAFIPAGESVTQQAVFHVADNKIASLDFIMVNLNRQAGFFEPDVTFKGWVYNRNVETQFEIWRHESFGSVENTVQFIDPINFALSPFDVVFFTAETDLNNTAVSCRFSLNTFPVL